MIDRLNKPRWLFFLWLLPALLLAPWLSDRTPPYKEISTPVPAPAKAGGVVYIIKFVERDLGRNCSVSFNRHLLDSKGNLYNYDAGYLSAETRAKIERDVGPFVKTKLDVPITTPPGSTTIYTDLAYSCNPLHELWPIRVASSVSFEVLP